jgi:hypothetical protein
MKLFGRTGGYWLFWTSVAYIITGFIGVFVLKYQHLEYIQAVYILAISLPLWVKPLARYFNMKLIWEV